MVSKPSAASVTGSPLAVQHPTRRQRLTLQVVNLDLVGCDGGGCHVQHERPVTLGRRRERQRVGPQHRYRGPGWHHADRPGGARDQSDQAVRRRHGRVGSGSAEMVRVEDGDRSQAADAGLADRQLHPHRRGRMAQPGICINQRRHRCFPNHPRHGMDVQLAQLAGALIVHQHGDTVRVHAGQVGRNHRVGRDPDRLFRHTPGGKHRHDLLVQALGRNQSHRSLGHGAPLSLAEVSGLDRGLSNTERRVEG